MREIAKDPESEEMLMTGQLETISKIFYKNKVRAILVGGLPVESALNQGRVRMVRNNGSTRDVDAIGAGPDAETVKKCEEEIQEQGRNFNRFPSIGLEPAFMSDQSHSPNPMQLLSGLRIDSRGRYFLYYGKVEQEINPVTMESVPIRINGVGFETVPLKTLYWRYVIRGGGGGVKPKDAEKLQTLATLIESQERASPTDSAYDEYREFAARVCDTYPLKMRLYNTYWRIDHALGEPFSGSQTLYTFIDWFRNDKEKGGDKK